MWKGLNNKRELYTRIFVILLSSFFLSAPRVAWRSILASLLEWQASPRMMQSTVMQTLFWTGKCCWWRPCSNSKFWHLDNFGEAISFFFAGHFKKGIVLTVTFKIELAEIFCTFTPDSGLWSRLGMFLSVLGEFLNLFQGSIKVFMCSFILCSKAHRSQQWTGRPTAHPPV